MNVIVSHRSSVELLSVHVCSSIKGGDRRQLHVGEHRDVFSEQRRHSGQRVDALCNILLRERAGGSKGSWGRKASELLADRGKLGAKGCDIVGRRRGQRGWRRTRDRFEAGRGGSRGGRRQKALC